MFEKRTLIQIECLFEVLRLKHSINLDNYVKGLQNNVAISTL